MSQDSQGSFFTATIMAVATFLLAFGCLWTLGDFSLVPAFFLAAIIAAIVWIILYIGIGSPNQTHKATPASNTATRKTAAPAAASSTESDAAAPVAASTPVREPSAEAAEAKRQADAQAAERAKAEEARRKVEEAERAEAKRKADADAAAAEAKRKADADAAEAAEAKRKADAAAAAEAAAAREAETSMTDNAAAATTPDYDGDGVREGTDEGTRPAGLDGPRDGKADDLKQIKGIGAKMEALCNRLGFWHFDQIAAWSADEVAWVDANLEGFKGRVTRDTWVEQARVLAGGGETEFSKRVEDGDVY